MAELVGEAAAAQDGVARRCRGLESVVMARDQLAPIEPGVTEKRRSLFSRSPIQVASTELAVETPKFSPKVSSAALRTIGDEDRAMRRRRRTVAQQDRVWQEKCYEAPLAVGELGYLVQLQANVTALCGFPVRRWDEAIGRWASNDREDDGLPFDPRPEGVMEALVGPNGGRAELIRKGAYHLFCAGEGNLVGTPIDAGSGIMWEFLSTMEVYPDADGHLIRRRSGMTSEDVEALGDDVYIARCLNPSPIYSDLADSEVRRVLPIVAEIKSLTQMVDATVKSRIPANILFIPEGMTLHGVGDTDDADSLAGDEDRGTLYDIDQLVEEIFEHVSQSQVDPLSAARLVPLVLVGAGEQGQYVKIIELSRELDGWAQELRAEALGRLARGLDSPPELIGGRASVNHWTSAIIDQDFLAKHIQPIGQLLADFLTVNYLRPMLETFEGMTREEAFEWKLDFDPSPVSARADEAQSARDMRDLLSDEAILSANGFDKADSVSEEQKTERRVWSLIETNPTLFAPLLLQLPGWEDYDLTDVLEAIAAQATAPAVEGEPPGLLPAKPKPKLDRPKADEQADNQDEIDDEEAAGDIPERPENLAALTQALVAEADLALDDALRKAGSRFVSHLQGADDSLKARAKSVSKQKLMATVTRADMASLGLNPSRLLRNVWDGLNDTTVAMTAAYLSGDGMDNERAHEAAAHVAQSLCTVMQEFLTERFHDTIGRGANGYRVPTSTVLAILEDVLPITV